MIANTTGPLTRVLAFEAETDHNAWLDAAPMLARLQDGGWREVSRVWAPNPVAFGDHALKGWFWARAAAGGRLTITLVHDPSIEPLQRLRRLTAEHDCLGAVVAVAAALAADVPAGSSLLDRSVAEVLAEGGIGSDLVLALADVPPRVRLEIERAHARSLCLAFSAPESPA